MFIIVFFVQFLSRFLSEDTAPSTARCPKAIDCTHSAGETAEIVRFPIPISADLFPLLTLSNLASYFIARARELQGGKQHDNCVLTGDLCQLNKL